jgi:hypothetical protein
MDRFIQHKNLKLVEILMSYQRREGYKDSPKVIALAKSTQRPYVSEKWSSSGEITYKTSYNKRNGMPTENYFLVWGEDDRFEESGYQLLVSASGKKVSFKTALKIFNDARKATEFLNFQKIQS